MVKYSKGRMIGGTMETVGLLAGIGILPVEFIEAAHIQGYKVVCIAVIPGVEKKLKEKADAYYEISVFKLNKVIKTLLSEGVQEVTMLGKVTKEWLYKDHVIPDLRALKVLNRLRKKNFKDDTITLELVEELGKDGISVLDKTTTSTSASLARMPSSSIFPEPKNVAGSGFSRLACMSPTGSSPSEDTSSLNSSAES